MRGNPHASDRGGAAGRQGRSCPGAQSGLNQPSLMLSGCTCEFLLLFEQDSCKGLALALGFLAWRRYAWAIGGGSNLELRVDLRLEPDADAVELEDATLSLRDELLELDVDAVERPPAGPPPEGAKAVEATILGTLVVEAGKDVIAAVIGAIQGWLGRGKSRSVKLQLGQDTIEITDLNAEDQHRLIEVFLARHVEAS